MGDGSPGDPQRVGEERLGDVFRLQKLLQASVHCCKTLRYKCKQKRKKKQAGGKKGE